MYCFCTYFDQNYLPRGLALYRSLREHCPEFKLWVLCMDEATYQVLTQLDLPEVEPISLQDFEKDDEPLLAAKQNRSKVEYYFTCTPSLLLYVLNHWPEVDLITYLDADLFFFAGPAPLFEELGTGSIAIIGHRFPPHKRGDEIYGIYNVGWLSFRRDENALVCLTWWREQCIEWCYDRIDEDRFADQKYLDDWPSRFRNVVVLEHRGANLAPWNLNNYRLRSLKRNTVMVDNEPLIFFHFHGLKQIAQWLYDPGLEGYGVTPSIVLRRGIYTTYIRKLDDVSRKLLPAPNITYLSRNIRSPMKQNEKQVSRIRRIMRKLRLLSSIGNNILTNKYIFYVKLRSSPTSNTTDASAISNLGSLLNPHEK